MTPEETREAVAALCRPTIGRDSNGYALTLTSVQAYTLLDALAPVLARIVAEARAEALREAADMLDERAANARAQDPSSEPDGRAYFQGQGIAFSAGAIYVRTLAALADTDEAAT